MKRYAVIAATDKYENISLGTPFCHNDAILLSETLSEFCDFSEQDILIHLLSPEADMSPSKLVISIGSIADRMTEGDTVIFYYAGHGAVYNNEPYLVLPHTDPNNLTQTALALRDISDKLRISGCINVRLFDACHSGFDVRDTNELLNDGGTFLRALMTERATGWFTFAACKHDESSHSDRELKHGVFTYYICDVLRSFPENSEIFPELLKIKVCEKVEKWCQAAHRIQTPTLIAAISGNLVIARTKKKLLSEVNNAYITSEAEMKGKESILERLSRIRLSIIPGTEEYLLRLEKYTNHLKDAIENNIGVMQSFGCTVSITQVLSANNIDHVFKKPIAQFVDREGLQSLHDIRIIEEREDYGGLIAGAALFGRPRVHYKYEVEQDESWPNSYIQMNVMTDGFLPSAAMFFYVIPLQIKVCILRGIGTSSDPTTDVNTFESTSLEQLFIDLNDDAVTTKVVAFAKNSISAFHESFTKYVEARLDYLESELKR